MTTRKQKSQAVLHQKLVNTLAEQIWKALPSRRVSGFETIPEDVLIEAVEDVLATLRLDVSMSRS